MRIEHLRVDAFGKLDGLDTGSAPLGPLVVVLGPNEAGKSTLFSFLTTSLYGFQPASRERNPHVPWGEDEAGGTIEVRLHDERCALIERRLRSSPSGRVTLGDETIELRNQPLPWVEHVPRTVFRQVFAITLAELAGLDQETWARIQDRVLGSMGASDIHPPRFVAEALEREAGEIWRPNRRGNQRLRELQDQLRALRARRNQALERDRTIRSLVDEGENLRFRLREMRAERQRDRVVVERVQELLPVKRRLDQIAVLREEGGDRDELKTLPGDPQEEVERLRAHLEQLGEQRSALERDMAAPEAEIALFDDRCRELLERRDSASRFLIRAAAADADRARSSRIQGELAELDVRLSSAADHLLDAPWQEQTAEEVMAVSIDLLRDRVERLMTLRREAPAPRGPAAVPADSLVDWIGPAILVAIGLVGLLWGGLGGPQVVGLAGSGLLAAGLTLLFLRSRRSRPTRPVLAPAGESADVLAVEVADMLRGLPLRSEYSDRPGAAVVSGLDRLQALIQQRREKVRELDEVGERIVAVEQDARELAGALGRDPEVDPVELAGALERDLREAERAREAAQSAGRERDRIDRAREQLSASIGNTGRELSKLEDTIATAGAGSGIFALASVQRRVEAHARADRLREDLERAHPDFAELEIRIEEVERNGASWTIDEEDLARSKVRIDELDAEIEEIVAKAEALDRDAAHLRDEETVDTVDSEILSLQEAEARLVAERDRKWVLAQLIREADRRFREEHQPDLLRRASAYLARLTGGRYDRLLVDEHSGGDLFQLVGPEIPAPIPLARPVSTGTLEQAYLSLRLAIVDHLDQGGERLPLFIDEAFVNWDEERRDRGLEVLSELSESRQVFAFTCHPTMAERLESRGGRLLRLER